jgi:flagellar protein FliS
MSYGAKSYKQTAIKTATPEQILLMLYEGAIKACKLAKIALEQKNVAEKCKQITKAHEIIMELNNTLDHTKGKELAGQLETLYDFAVGQLLKANIENDIAAIETVTKIMTTLYEGWVAAVESLKKKETSV